VGVSVGVGVGVSVGVGVGVSVGVGVGVSVGVGVGVIELLLELSHGRHEFVPLNIFSVQQ
jgi:hypothetical protein